MGNYSQAMFERTTKFYAESATEWQLKLIVWEFFCTLTWSGRARNCVRKRRTHVTRWLRYWARTVRPAVADSLGQLAFAEVNYGFIRTIFDDGCAGVFLCSARSASLLCLANARWPSRCKCRRKRRSFCR